MGKATQGNRDKGGRRKRIARVSNAHDYGNQRVVALVERFARFDKRIKYEDVHDGPGRARVAGLFDGLNADPVALKDAAREYADLYWYWFADRLPKSPNFERSAKGYVDGIPPVTARERRFMRLDEMLPMGSVMRDAIHDLCVDSWGADEISPWLERLIAFREAMAGRNTSQPRMASDADWFRWNQCVAGLMMMVQGRNQSRDGSFGTVEIAA